MERGLSRAYPLGCEPVVEDVERRRLLWLMAEFFRTLGYTDLCARLPGHTPPPVLSGTVEDHRPDLTCRQSNASHTPLLLEVVTANGVEDARAENRWCLMASAARLFSAELHFVVPKWAAQGAIDALLRRRLECLNLVPHRVWAV
ncbi:MAG TPA: hypothetical protein VKE49_03220 [Myxococcaceae bacterium]|nr:hypothetical protein [Myxococcaceae bacterium]